MNNLEILFNLIIHPNYALKRMDKSLSLSIMVVVAALWSSAVSNYLVRGMPVDAVFFSLNIISAVVVTLLFLVLSVSIWHFISESFKGEGKVTELFICICLSLLPYIFLTPMALIIKFSGIDTLFYWLFFSMIVIWGIILKILSLKVVYGLNGPLATLTYFIPVIVIFAIFFLIFILIIMFFAVTASQALTPFLEL